MAEACYEEVWILTRGRRKTEGAYHRLTADRNDEAAFERCILDAGVHWDVVFDCICMNEAHARQDIGILGQRTQRLVVISTDSVYASEYKKVLQTEEGIFVGDRPARIEIPSYAMDKRRMEKVFESYFAQQRTDGQRGMQITIFRPGHIFGPGFLSGCFPMQSRQADLPETMKKGKLSLVGGGCYLIHPIYVEDLAGVMLDCVEKERTFQEIFCVGGPEIIENRTYYEILARIMGVETEIEEIPLTGFVESHPEYYGHLCHRAYDLTKLARAGVTLPSTTVEEGLRAQYRYWRQREMI